MTSNKKIIFLAAFGALTACSYSGPRYVPRPDVPADQYTVSKQREDRSDRQTYNAYEHREPCQEYRRIPRNSVAFSNCLVMKRAVTEKMAETEVRLLPIIHSYTVYFDFDRDVMRADQNAVLDQVTREINKYEPTVITVTGYADRSGKVSYNEELSRRRTRSVSEALLRRGIVNEEMDRESRGEFENAVPTADGVRMPENRRVVIDFRR